ncbi:hypothetical protein BURKHO8Y_70144 [Burkholderia sp. 8Y]|nr:hypothetical protein BURKHO8Y_70144 [Burkholderia sp. 8Y]
MSLESVLTAEPTHPLCSWRSLPAAWRRTATVKKRRATSSRKRPSPESQKWVRRFETLATRFVIASDEAQRPFMSAGA